MGDYYDNCCQFKDGILKAASFEYFINYILTNNVKLNDPYLLPGVFSAASSFTDDRKLFGAISAGFYQEQEKALKATDVIKTWVHSCPSLFEAGTPLRSDVDNFVRTLESCAPQYSKLVLAALKKVDSRQKPQTLESMPYYDGFEKASPEEIAKQLTLYEMDHFRMLDAADIVRNTDNLKKYIEIATKISNWGSAYILEQHTAKEAAKAVAFMIKVTKSFFNIGNTSGLMAMIPVFTISSIHRLKPVWDSVSRGTNEKIEKWNALLSPQGSYKQYREYLATKTPPELPFIGMFLTDLTYSNEGNQTFLDPGKTMINFDRLRNIGKAVAQIEPFQTSTFGFQPIPGFVKHVFERYQYSDKQFLKLSHILFPLRESQLEMIEGVELPQTSSQQSGDNPAGFMQTCPVSSEPQYQSHTQQRSGYAGGAVAVMPGMGPPPAALSKRTNTVGLPPSAAGAAQPPMPGFGGASYEPPSQLRASASMTLQRSAPMAQTYSGSNGFGPTSSGIATLPRGISASSNGFGQQQQQSTLGMPSGNKRKSTFGGLPTGFSQTSTGRAGGLPSAAGLGTPGGFGQQQHSGMSSSGSSAPLGFGAPSGGFGQSKQNGFGGPGGANGGNLRQQQASASASGFGPASGFGQQLPPTSSGTSGFGPSNGTSAPPLRMSTSQSQLSSYGSTGSLSGGFGQGSLQQSKPPSFEQPPASHQNGPMGFGKQQQQPSGFGKQQQQQQQQQQQNNSSGFGLQLPQTNGAMGFGQAQQKVNGPQGFGQSQQGKPAGFGQRQNNPQGFGQTPPQQSKPAGLGVQTTPFGQSAQQQGSHSEFGKPSGLGRVMPAPAQQSSPNGFGAPTHQKSSGSMGFGSNSNILGQPSPQQPKQTNFGQQQQQLKPLGFGQQQQQTQTSFGQSAAPRQNRKSVFGQQQQQQQQQPQNKPLGFGSQPSQPSGSMGFGQQQARAGPAGFGAPVGTGGAARQQHTSNNQNEHSGLGFGAASLQTATTPTSGHGYNASNPTRAQPSSAFNAPSRVLPGFSPAATKTGTVPNSSSAAPSTGLSSSSSQPNVGLSSFTQPSTGFSSSSQQSAAFGSSSAQPTTGLGAAPMPSTGFSSSSAQQSTGFGSSVVQQSTGFGSSPSQSSTGFGSSQPSTGFGASSQSNTGFGASQPTTGLGAAPMPSAEFGSSSAQSNAGFGSPSQLSTGFSSSQPSAGFGSSSTQQNTGFGSSEQSNAGFGSSVQSNTGFGTSQPATGFSSPSQSSTGFSSSQPSTGFGSSSQSNATFGSSSAQPTTGLGAAPMPSTGFSSSSAQQSTGFGSSSAQPNTGFGSSSSSQQSTGFGSPSQSNTGFGSSAQQSSGFGAASSFDAGSSSQPAFGAPSGGFGGFGAPQQGQGFGASSNQPAAFGQPPLQGGSGQGLSGYSQQGGYGYGGYSGGSAQNQFY